MIEITAINPASRASPNCLNVQWLTDIICHLRDDLAAEQEQDLPPDADIVAWVQQAYYPGLLELTWEEAVLSLLHRMQHAPPAPANAGPISPAQLSPNCAAPPKPHRSGRCSARPPC